MFTLYSRHKRWEIEQEKLLRESTFELVFLLIGLSQKVYCYLQVAIFIFYKLLIFIIKILRVFLVKPKMKVIISPDQEKEIEDVYGINVPFQL